MSQPSETTTLPAKLKPLKVMAQKLETMELHNLQPLGSTTLLPLVPSTTPTICLSVPTTSHLISHESPHHHKVSLIPVPGTTNADLGGISNAGYVSDGSVTPVNRMESALNGKLSSLSHVSTDREGFQSSRILSSSPCPSGADSVFSSNGDLNQLPLNNVKRGLALSVSLGLPNTLEMMMAKRFSLPNAGTIEHLSPRSAKMAIFKSSDPLTSSNSHRLVSRTASPHNGDLLNSQTSSPASKSSWGMGQWFQKRPSAAGSMSSMSDVSCMSNSLDEDNGAANTRQKLQDLVKSVAQRAKKIGCNEVAPISTVSATLAPPPIVHNVRKRLDSFAPSSVTDTTEEVQVKKFQCCGMRRVQNFLLKHFPDAIDPTGGMWLAWLSIVALFYIYNAVSIFLRASFNEDTYGSEGTWFILDYTGDFVFLLDICLRTRMLYFENGQVVRDKVLLRKHYTKTLQFRFDVLCLLPLDFLYFIPAIGVHPIVRLPRLLKGHSYNEFVEKFENKSKSANSFRIVKTIGYMLYMIHLNTCCYFVISEWEGIGSNRWVYDGKGNAYVRCLFRATKTLITIGNLPAPKTTFEIFFMNMDFMIGVFVFATIIGQMRDIVGAAGATKGAFRRRMDNTMSLLQNWKIPEDVQRRVRLWFMYSWDRRELLDEQEIMKNVPIKMQTDIAIHVHMDTLSKVSLFQDCDKMLLRDLVLKLRPVLFLPGDYICRKSEVGKEMYIIKNGLAQVLGGQNNRAVLATLHPGSYFGEISLLSVGVGNRRTADVYSPGYSNLFVLDKKVLQEVVVNYPDAQESLKRKAREILKKNQANDSKSKKRRGKSLIAESILLKDRNSQHKFFNAVLEVSRTSKIASTILRASYRSGLNDIEDEAVQFSNSDISSDEMIFGTREQRKKKKRLVKRAKKQQHERTSNDDSESQNEQGRSDSDLHQEHLRPKRTLRRTASVLSPNPSNLRFSSSGSRTPRESMGNMNLLWDKEEDKKMMGRSSITGNVPLEEDEEDGTMKEHEQGRSAPRKATAKSSFSGIKERHRMARSISDVEREEKRARKKLFQHHTTEVTQRSSSALSVHMEDSGTDKNEHLTADENDNACSADEHSEDIDKGVSSDSSTPSLSGEEDQGSKASTLQGEGYDSSSEASPESRRDDVQ